MVEDSGKRRLTRTERLLGIALIVQAVPNGLLAAILFNLIGTFGVKYTVDSILLNQDVFANQYARLVVYAGWSASVSVVVLLVIAGIQVTSSWRRKSGRPTSRK